MVCPRCIETVEQVLTDNGFNVQHIKLGEVEIDKEPSLSQMKKIAEVLKERGFELLIDKKSQTVDRIKSEIIKLVHHNENEILDVNLSTHLVHLIGGDYSALSNLFSSMRLTFF